MRPKLTSKGSSRGQAHEAQLERVQPHGARGPIATIDASVPARMEPILTHSRWARQGPSDGAQQMVREIEGRDLHPGLRSFAGSEVLAVQPADDDGAAAVGTKRWALTGDDSS